MIPEARRSALKDTSWQDFALRFILGGIATVCTGLIASRCGPVTGGLFLAFPAICCASLTLVAKHEKQRKQKAGLQGTRRGQQAAALDSVGAALGSFGLIAFGAVVWQFLPSAGAAVALTLASATWLLVAILLWWGRRFLRRPRGRRGLADTRGFYNW